MNRRTTIRQIGQRTRLTNAEVQLMLETLVEVWTEALIGGERIEIENLFVLEVQTIDRGTNSGMIGGHRPAPRRIRRLTVRASKHLKRRLHEC